MTLTYNTFGLAYWGEFDGTTIFVHTGLSPYLASNTSTTPRWMLPNTLDNASLKCLPTAPPPITIQLSQYGLEEA